MPAPNKELRDELAEVLRLVADEFDISPDSLTSIDLQAMGYGFRLAAAESEDRHLYEMADALDWLSTLDNAALSYLETVTRTPRATA